MNVCHMDLSHFNKVAIKKEVINSIVDSFDLDEVGMSGCMHLKQLNDQLAEVNKASLHGGFPKTKALAERVSKKIKEMEKMHLEGVDIVGRDE